ncbi:hypothetical protein PRUPE_6G122200 [Prunus persica]|uniref:Uncharacterized protein n=1 Tax=Prunus persica TaxID=3760 RepID=M5VXY3_PRUPE|nr:hypothetical protein PRUPE_6G122200 [Prunus persica]
MILFPYDKLVTSVGNKKSLYERCLLDINFKLRLEFLENYLIIPLELSGALIDEMHIMGNPKLDEGSVSFRS